MIRLEMKKFSMILTEMKKNISTLLSYEINKYEYLTGEEILFFDQSRFIEQVKFTYSPLGKASKKQIKTIESQGKKKKTIKGHDAQLIQSNPFHYEKKRN